MAGWLTLMCLSPVFGAVLADAFRVPEAAEPVLAAAAAGILAQAAWVSLRAAFRSPSPQPGQLLLSRSAAVTAMAASVTALAVYGVG